MFGSFLIFCHIDNEKWQPIAVPDNEVTVIYDFPLRFFSDQLLMYLMLRTGRRQSEIGKPKVGGRNIVRSWETRVWSLEPEVEGLKPEAGGVNIALLSREYLVDTIDRSL